MNFILIVVCFIPLVSFCHANIVNTVCYPQVCDKSKCCEGYHVIDNECMPICEGGCPPSQVCLEPNKCGCEDNTADLKKDDRCKLCITTYNHNALPYTCYKCTPNYTFYNNECKHLCHDNCTNNDCYNVVDDSRKCNAGYQENPNTKACEPISSTRFVNCIKGSNCDESFPSSTANDEDIIISTTDVTLNNCQNGICQETTSSTSKKSFSSSTTQITSNCIDGTCQNKETSSTTSKPIDVTLNCQNECLNGICLNGICQKTTSSTSNESFRTSTTQKTLDCVDGTCQNKETSSTTSKPIDVTLNCQNGICQKTTSSTSTEDSSISTTQTTQTTPKCINGIWQNEETYPTTSIQIDVRFNSEKKCINGICGFCQETTSSPTQNTSKCIDKQCQMEKNGDKIEENVTLKCQKDKDGNCQCKDGLILNEKTNECIMPCENNNCQNGICNQDGKCHCNQGYVYQNDSVGCVPYCDRECINSICVAPTQCECIEGDISSLNISSAIKCPLKCLGADGRNDCQNGTCVAVNKCQCLEGFFQNPAIGQFECIPVYVSWQDCLRKTLKYSIWIIVILALIMIIIALVHFAQERKRLVNENVGVVDEVSKVGEVCNLGEIGGVEKYRSIVMFEVNEELDCKFTKKC